MQTNRNYTYEHETEIMMIEADLTNCRADNGRTQFLDTI